MDTVNDICEGRNQPVTPTEKEAAEAQRIVWQILAGERPLLPSTDGEAYSLRDQLLAALPPALSPEQITQTCSYIQQMTDAEQFEMATLLLQSLLRHDRNLQQTQDYVNICMGKLGEVIAQEEEEET